MQSIFLMDTNLMLEYALKCLKAAYDQGAKWIVLCDTNGGTLPHEVTKIVSDSYRAYSWRKFRYPRT